MLTPTPPKKPTAAQARRMRTAARLHAVQALFQMEAADAALDTVIEEFETHRVGAEIDGDLVVLLTVRAGVVADAVAETIDVVPMVDNALGEQEAGSQLEVVTG